MNPVNDLLEAGENMQAMGADLERVQRIVTDSMDAMHCTRLVIAHRLSTIRACDRIIALDGGKIVESGTYEELIERDGFFAELLKRQQIEENGE